MKINNFRSQIPNDSVNLKNNKQKSPSFGVKVDYSPETACGIGKYLRAEFSRLYVGNLGKSAYNLPPESKGLYKIPEVVTESEYRQLRNMADPSYAVDKPYIRTAASIAPKRYFSQLPKEVQEFCKSDVFIPIQSNVNKLFSNIKTQIERLTANHPKDTLYMAQEHQLVNVHGVTMSMKKPSLQLVYKTPDKMLGLGQVRPGKIYNAAESGDNIVIPSVVQLLPEQRPERTIIEALGGFVNGSCRRFYGNVTKHCRISDNEKFQEYSKMFIEKPQAAAKPSAKDKTKGLNIDILSDPFENFSL
jgi:hypothetical protein